ncbi:MAG: hypothetical protein COW75_08370 [Rhodobacterales bacterium CG18_big_fil_WC_8_21_14_2_50_71_9]|nr:MAG: hypothetical protein COW75_08370 [Rhodobacterales bacterium CG18_big_fil_WC_8_21_14_2_50_71_9]PIY74846.1 MAG: hypothetical protein COY86_01240 [Rhodobacterales bacterium CG_4_10_14_0_8_um_filter_70_9]PJA61056.1 MAG: hypothetical protein CO163_00280 [Rhodobacterales bacterium CG_4_9_14_3_um_filter_71_31]
MDDMAKVKQAPQKGATHARKVRLTKQPAPTAWFAEVDGAPLPVALQQWARFGAGSNSYSDPLTLEGRGATPRSPEYFSALRDGVVVLARAHVVKDAKGEDAIKREGWIGLYRVANVEASDAGVSFDFVERLATF